MEQQQMDMMTMMMLQHLPEFSEPYTHSMEGFHPPSEEFYSNNNNNNNNNIRNTMQLADLINNNSPLSPIPWSSSYSFTHLPASTTTISFSNNNQPTTPIMLQEQEQQYEGANANPYGGEKRNSMAAMREMIFRIAAMQPIHIDPESVKAPKRRNVKISKDPQSVAARHRRERISERIRILQRLVPGGTKMDTASMLDEAIHYVKFLKTQVQSLERASSDNNNIRPLNASGQIGFPVASTPYFPLPSKPYQAPNMENMHHTYH